MFNITIEVNFRMFSLFKGTAQQALTLSFYKYSELRIMINFLIPNIYLLLSGFKTYLFVQLINMIYSNRVLLSSVLEYQKYG